MAQLSEEVYKSRAINDIAESLVYRKFQTQDRESTTSALSTKINCDSFHDIYPLMAFNVRNMAGILSRGFLNIHQTGKGNGGDSPVSRLPVENQLAQMDLANAPKELFPKYAYAVSDSQNYISNSRVTLGYGETFVRFKPNVLRRATYTLSDSFVDKHARSSYSCNAGPLNGGGFYEMQIWGTLSIQDVAYFIADCPGLPSSSVELISDLTNAHLQLPVFKCRMEGLVPQRGNQLYGKAEASQE